MRLAQRTVCDAVMPDQSVAFYPVGRDIIEADNERGFVVVTVFEPRRWAQEPP